ncbi:terminase large subunit domain-containing protein [Candidatus Cytomitobacter primus]|uniref:DNA-packaging protein n=1 Tax=Candidatus Cytomitobacter primus TaxID=2066024 RepID=A0A5C0UEV9_9PROT|nr:terminase family protein [Candidatus Cytomitobacter primus]QEK38588.1 DNA-packaging protein [Candidatus Cytomitobacter primus]
MHANIKLLEEIYSLGIKLINQEERKYDWRMQARDNQKIPQWDWRIWLLLAGRGFGKTRTGSESIKQFVQMGYKNICLLGKTKEEVRKIMVDGQSGILSVYSNKEKPKFFASQNILKWKNGAIAQIHSADSYESLRGPQFDLAWVDELAKFNNLDEAWDQLMMTMRLGIPKIIVTTTPKPIPLLHKIIKRSDVHYTSGNTMENKLNLSKEYLSYIKNEYEGTNFGKQEISGELLDKITMWSDNNILRKEMSTSDISQLSNIIISIDPAVTNNENSDETGIIVVGKKNDEFYVLEDKSGKWSMSEWPKVCAELCQKYKTNNVIAEINQGGDMIEQLIKMQNRMVRFQGIRSVHNKIMRAQPIACLYDHRRVFHIGTFTELEKQMKSFPGFSKSPDRVDALVIGINHINKTNRIFSSII